MKNTTKANRCYGSPPYAAVRYFRSQAGRHDNRNYLESWEVRGNMLAQLISVMCRFIYFGEKKKDFVPFQIGFRSLRA